MSARQRASRAVLKRPDGFFLTFGKDHGKEGLPVVGGNPSSTQLYDQQIWRILRANASFLEVCSAGAVAAR